MLNEKSNNAWPVLNWVMIMLLFLPACMNEKIDITGPSEPPSDISFSNDVSPILQSSCSGSGCHIPEGISGVQLGSYQNVVNSEGTQYGKKIVVPGDAEASPIIDKLKPSPQYGQRMPYNRPALSSTQIAKIEAWINQGAKDN